MKTTFKNEGFEWLLEKFISFGFNFVEAKLGILLKKETQIGAHSIYFQMESESCIWVTYAFYQGEVMTKELFYLSVSIQRFAIHITPYNEVEMPKYVDAAFEKIIGLYNSINNLVMKVDDHLTQLIVFCRHQCRQLGIQFSTSNKSIKIQISRFDKMKEIPLMFLFVGNRPCLNHIRVNYSFDMDDLYCRMELVHRLKIPSFEMVMGFDTEEFRRFFEI